MKRTQQRDLPCMCLHAMAELRRLGHRELLARGLIRKGPQAHHNLGVFEEREFSIEKWSTSVALGGKRLVARRRTAHRRRYERVGQHQAVVAGNRFGLVGQARSKHGPIEPVSRTVTGKHAAGAIRSMSSRSKSEHHDACLDVTEAADGFSPILVVPIRGPFRDGNLFTPSHQSRAGSTRFDLSAEFAKRVHD